MGGAGAEPGADPVGEDGAAAGFSDEPHPAAASARPVPVRSCRRFSWVPIALKYPKSGMPFAAAAESRHSGVL
jgi:hypothetical protein